MLALMLDRSDANAPNQAMVFSQTVLQAKQDQLAKVGDVTLREHITIDSPVPYEISNVLEMLNVKNVETKTGASGRPVQGDFYGKLSRFIQRLDAKLTTRD